MVKKLKRALVMLLAVAMICTSVPMNVQAATNSDAVSFGGFFDRLFGASETSTTSATPTAMAISGADSVNIGSSITLNVAATEPAGAALDTSSVEWISSNTSMATVSGGVVTGIATGTVKITARLTLSDGTLLVATKNIAVSGISAAHHYMLDPQMSSNVVLYYTTGGELQLLNPGDEVVTTSSNIYFFVKVIEGYKAETSFRHAYTASGTGYSSWTYDSNTGLYGDGFLYDEINSSRYTDMPHIDDAKAAGCTYKCQYTGKSISGDNAFWCKFGIVGDPIEIRVSYQADGAEAGTIPTDNKSYYHNNVTEAGCENHTITLGSAPTAEGKTFYGWMGPDNVLRQPGDTVDIKDLWGSLNGSEEVVFTAQWQDKVKVAYYGNGATSGTAVFDNNFYAIGQEAVVLPNTWVNYNNTFIGWADDDGNIYQPGEKITVTASTKLYAQWQPKQTVAINYEVIGDGSTSPSVEYVNPDDGKAVGSTAAPANGSHFIGWFNAAGQKVGTDLEFIPSTPQNGWGNGATFTAVFEKNVEVTVTADSSSVLYDGKTHKVSGFSVDGVSGNTFTYDGETYTIEGLTAQSEDAKDAGEYAVTVSGTAVVKKGTEDVTELFTVNTVDGTLTIKKRSVTITSASATAAYTGKPLVKKEYMISGDGFVSGDAPTVTVTGSQTAVGTSKNTFTYTALDESVAKNYETIKTVEGDLTVYDRDATGYEINITPNSDTVTYNGQAQTVSGFTVNGAVLTETADGVYAFTSDGIAYTLEGISASATGTDAGSYDATVSGTAVIKDADGNDVTGQFLVNLGKGSLKIEPKAVTITSASAEKSYDGTPLTRNQASDITAVGFVAGQGAAYTFDAKATQTLVGQAENKFTYTLNAGTSADNYVITTEFGTLTVKALDEANKIELEVTANSGIFTYDGMFHSVQGFTSETDMGYAVVQKGGVTYYVSGIYASAYAMDANVYPVNITGTPVVKDSQGNVVTDQFKVTLNPGTLTISPRSITVVAASDSKAYDGTALTNSNVTIKSGSFVNGQGASFTVEGSRTLVGVSDNVITKVEFNTNTKSSNYQITTLKGTLTVTDRGTDESPLYEVQIQANGGEFTYDGQTHSVSGFENEGTDGIIPVTIGTLTFYVDVNGLTATASATNAGTTETTVSGSYVVRDADGSDVTAQFEVNIAAGKLIIDRRPVTLTSATASKVYDGTALTAREVTDELTGGNGEEGFLEAERAGVSYDFADTAQVTQVGYAVNEFTANFDESQILSSNYYITYDFGTLTVTDRDAADRYQVSVTANSLIGDDAPMYNGTEQTVTGFIGETATGRVPVTVEENGSTMTYYVNVNNMTATAKGTDVLESGYYETEFSGYFTVEDADGNDVTAQFNVTAVPGRLSILPRTVELTSGSGEKEYDGTALTNDTITIGGDGFIDGDLVSAVATGSQLLVGRSFNLIEYELRQDMSSSNYVITTNAGILKVTDRAEGKKFEITAVANGDTVKYDGAAHTVSGYTVSGGAGTGSFTANADGYSFTVNGVSYTLSGLATTLVLGNSTEAVDAGSYDVLLDGRAVVKDAAGNDVTDQFKVNLVDSELVINKRSVVLTSATSSKEYDGKELTAPTVEVSGDGFADGEGATYVFADTAKVSKPNTTVINAFEYVLKTGTKADNYNITKVEGTLTVTGRRDDAKYGILVEAKSGYFIYDGEEHTIGGFATSNTYDIDGATFTLTGLSAADVTAKDYQAGGYPVNITGTAVVTDEFGNDVTDQFLIGTNNGLLTIAQRPIMLTSASAQKVYDGSALKAESAEDSLNIAGRIDEAGFVGGDGATYEFTGTRTLPGTSENTFTYTLNDGTKADNYVISTTNGTLNVQNRGTDENPLYTIALQPISAEVVYNGTEQSIEGFVTTTFEFDGQTYEVKDINAVSKGTEPGQYFSTYSGTAVVVDADGNDVTSQFAIDTSAVGTLTIKGIYTLTINYVDAAGATLAPSYVASYVEGTQFGPIVSPAVTGYTPNYSSVSSPAGGMPNRNVTVNVVYTRINVVTPPAGGGETPTTPDDNTPEPTPGNTPDNPTPAAVTPAGPIPVPATTVTPADNNGQDGETIGDEEPPAGVISFDDDGNAEIVDIDEEPTALASGAEEAAWALINLIAAILTAVICIVLLVTWFIGKKKDEEDDEDEENNNKAMKTSEDEDEEEEEKKRKRHTLLRLLSIIPAVASVIIFILTENMRNPMILVDRWTILMIVLLIVNILLAFFSRKKKKDEDDEKEDENKNKVTQ